MDSKIYQRSTRWNTGGMYSPTNLSTSISNMRRYPVGSREEKEEKMNRLSLADRIQLIREKQENASPEHVWRGSSTTKTRDLHSLLVQYRKILGHQSRLSNDVRKSIADARSSANRVRLFHDSGDSRLDLSTLAYTAAGTEKSIYPDFGGSSTYSSYTRSMSDVSLPVVSSASSEIRRGHLLDGADNSNDGILSLFDARPKTKSAASQPKWNTGHGAGSSVAAMVKHYQQVSDDYTKSTLSSIVDQLTDTKWSLRDAKTQNVNQNSDQKLKTKPPSLLWRDRQFTKQENNRCYQFVGQSLTRSFSLPNISEILAPKTTDYIKDYTEVDMEKVTYPRNPESVSSISTTVKKRELSPSVPHTEEMSTRASRGRRHGRIVLPPLSHRDGICCRQRPSTRTDRNPIDTRLYLRSRSCCDRHRNQTPRRQHSSIPRLVSLYKDLKSFDSFTIGNGATVKMTFKTRNYHSLDLSVTWGSNIKQEKLSLYTKPSYSSDTRGIGNIHYRKLDFKKVARQPRSFVYPGDIPLQTLNGGGDDVDQVQRFMECSGKQSDHQYPPVRCNYNRYHRRCIPERQWRLFKAEH